MEPIQFPDNTFDFVILTLGRSGSHMLASALDSHPEIQCYAEIYVPNRLHTWLGEKEKSIKGTTVLPTQIKTIGKVSKAIVLTRNWKDRVKQTTYPEMHALRPAVAELINEDLSALETEQLEKETALHDAAKTLDCLYLKYEDITGNEDIRVIPETIGKSICAFLGAEYQPLVPVFYKPRIVT